MKKVKLTDVFQLVFYVVMVFVVFNFVSGHSLRIINLSMLFAITALGLSITLGMTGMLSFSGISFMGFGAYTVANLCTGRHGVILSPTMGVVMAILVSGVLAVIIGAVLLRLNGTFFTFATIALVYISNTIFINYVPLFGGSSGISGIPTYSVGSLVIKGYEKWFLFVAIIVGVVCLLVERARRTQLGRSLESIRDDEIIANSLGINVFRSKLIAFTLQGVLCGLAGALYAMQNSYIGSDVFTWTRATSIVIMVMVGGVNNTLGAVIGSVIVTALPEIFRGFQQYLRFAYGIVIILLMIFLPSGIMGIGSAVKSFLAKAKKKNETNAGGKMQLVENENSGEEGN